MFPPTEGEQLPAIAHAHVNPPTLPSRDELAFIEDMLSKVTSDVDAVAGLVDGLVKEQLRDDGIIETPGLDPDVVTEALVGQFVVFARTLRLLAGSVVDDSRKIEEAVIEAHGRAHEGLPPAPQYVEQVERLASSYEEYVAGYRAHARRLLQRDEGEH